MNMHDFLNKYGTRAVSIVLRQRRDITCKEMADDLQAALEAFITHDKLLDLSIAEAMQSTDGAKPDE